MDIEAEKEGDKVETGGKEEGERKKRLYYV